MKTRHSGGKGRGNRLKTISTLNGGSTNPFPRLTIPDTGDRGVLSEDVYTDASTGHISKSPGLPPCTPQRCQAAERSQLCSQEELSGLQRFQYQLNTNSPKYLIHVLSMQMCVLMHAHIQMLVYAQNFSGMVHEKSIIFVVSGEGNLVSGRKMA